ncbi:monooxygenase 2-like [Rhodamnia argentea]|uniref:Monooxygenase 2-like n=1 Tax=Rhodamnia argentea TaxID=178133 RepID=A0ABM3GVL5_9MYRT|nr:monooxygenase 2-like [Rhodamnia argentea]
MVLLWFYYYLYKHQYLSTFFLKELERVVIKGLHEGYSATTLLRLSVATQFTALSAALVTRQLYCRHPLFPLYDSGMEKGAKPEKIQREVSENLAKDFPPIYLDVVKNSNLSNLTWAPLMFRYSRDVLFSKLTRENITVAGDALHPMTPDLGQGGCSALEDAVVLVRHVGDSISKHGKLVTYYVKFALERYAKERRWRAATLITASYLSGWVQQDWSGRLMKFLRDVVFYRLLLTRVVRSVAQYDCGKLPRVFYLPSCGSGMSI